MTITDDMHPTAPLLPRNPDVESLALFKKHYQHEPTILQWTGAAPWLSRHVLLVSGWTPKHATAVQIEVAGFVAAQENACRYCSGVARAMLRLRGHSQEWISRVERNVNLGEGGESTMAVANFARQLARSNPRPARPEYDKLRALGISDEAIREVAFIVADTCGASRVTEFLAVTPEEALEALPDKLLVRLFRPLVMWLMLRLAKPVLPEVRAADYKGPFAFVVGLLEGIEAADIVAEALTLTFGESILPRRTKLLIWAVIARGMMCPTCEEEVRRHVLAAGIDETTLAEVLDHLAADGLDETERVLIPWARETVRYDPATMYKRMRVLADRIGADTTVNAVGVAAMANVILRLAMLLDCQCS